MSPGVRESANRLTRRGFSAMGAAGALMPLLGAPARKKIAAIVTEYRFWSHADVIIGRLLGGYSANGIHTEPRIHVVSLYTDQVPANDMSRDLAARHGFRIYPSIREALTLGGSKLAVDGVAFVGEHGNYPTNDLGQKLYPRHELFMQILDTFEQSGRPVPTFFDKHLSYSWPKAKELYDRAKRLRVPMLAGSSIPVTIREPALEIPLNTPLEVAVGLGHGDLDAYGFHLLESMQCMLERRAGGETGLESVQLLEGDAVFRWRDSAEGEWSKPLIEEALRRMPSRKPVPLEQEARNPAVYVLGYKDGLRAAGFLVTRSGNDRTFAVNRKGTNEVYSTSFGPSRPGRPLPHFDGFVKCIEDLFVTGEPAYPIERTLLTTGALAFAFESKRTGKAVRTPELSISYKAPARAYFQRA